MTGRKWNSAVQPNNNESWQFQRKVEKLDWRKLAAVDLEKIAQNLDFQILQDNIKSVTFCNLENEFDVSALDPSLVKLFGLAQLIIEYLLHCQEFLNSSLAEEEEKSKKALENVEKLIEEKKKLEGTVKELRIENKKRRKLLEWQQANFALGFKTTDKTINNAQQSELQRCPYCPKAFLNVPFLFAHLGRRHRDRSTVPINFPRVVPTFHDEPLLEVKEKVGEGNAGETREIQRDVVELKERLRAAEIMLKEETETQKNAGTKKENELLDREENIRKNMEKFQQELEKKHQEEISALKDMFQQELNKIQQKPPAFTAQTPHFDSTELLEQMHKQELEIHNLQDQLKSQLSKDLGNVEGRLEAQERYWKTKMKQMQSNHADDMQRLQDILEKSQKEGHMTNSKHAMQIQDLHEQSLEQEAKLRNQEEKIKDLAIEKQDYRSSIIGNHPVPIPKTRMSAIMKSDNNTAQPKILHSTPKREIHELSESSIEIESEEETLESKEEDVPLDLPTKEHQVSKKITPSKKVQAKVIKKEQVPSMKKMKKEIEEALNERLRKLGIEENATGISNYEMNSKLVKVKMERNKLAKKFPDYQSIRTELEREVKARFQERLKVRSRSISPKTDTVIKFMTTINKNVAGVSPDLKESSSGESRRMQMKTSPSPRKTPSSSESLRKLPRSAPPIIRSSMIKNRDKSIRKSVSMMLPAKIMGEDSTEEDENVVEDEEDDVEYIEDSFEYEESEDEEDIEDEENDSEREETESEPQLSYHMKMITPEKKDTVVRNLLPSFEKVASEAMKNPNSSTWNNQFKSSLDLNNTQDFIPSSSALNIQLKRPAGSLVAQLSKSIEDQLRAPRKKPVGGINVMNEDNKINGEIMQDDKNQSDIESISIPSLDDHEQRASSGMSSNTLRSSMWGSSSEKGKNISAATEERPVPKPRAGTSHSRKGSWDSDTDLDISEVT